MPNRKAKSKKKLKMSKKALEQLRSELRTAYPHERTIKDFETASVDHLQNLVVQYDHIGAVHCSRIIKDILNKRKN